MKSLIKSVLCLQVATAFLTATLAAPAAEKSLPFHGSITANETSSPQPPTLFVDGGGFGNATHLGRFAFTYEVEVNLATRASVGTAIFTAANGDTIIAEFTGQGTLVEGTDLSSIVENYTITDGTGRFEGATGDFTLQRILNRVTGVSTGSFDGNIALQH